MNNNKINFTKKSISLLRTQYWLFTKQKSNFLLLLVFLAAGFYGLYQGYAFKQKQAVTITTFNQDKLNKLTALQKGFDADTTNAKGKEAYEESASLFAGNWAIILAASKTPNTTSIFAIGQADVFPYYYSIKLESFFMQLFKQSEIANPLRSLAGHFDTSFWIIFLLPLLLILLCFNTLSSELDNGNWKLITSQGISAKKWIGNRYLLVGLLVEILLAIIFFTGLFINYFHFNQSPSFADVLFFAGANLYILFWLAILYFINSFGKSTSFNALCSGMAWTLICIIVPSITTLLIEKSVPVDNTSISRMSRRPQGSKFEDDAFGINIIKQFVNSRPQYQGHKLAPQNPAFKLAIYMVYHELMDDSNAIHVADYFKAIEQRQQLTNLSSLLNPAAALDGTFARLAENDAFANHQFVWQTKALHANYHDAFFPAMFFDGQLSKNQYAKFPVFQYESSLKGSIKILLSYLFLLIAGALFFLLGSINIAKIKQ